MVNLAKIHHRHIALMKTTSEILMNILQQISQETATTYRDPNDGDKGWTTLEVLCHLRDFDGYFRGRAEMMLAQERPTLPAYDHEAIAIENNYNSQDFEQVLSEFVQSRQQTIQFFKSLTDKQWESDGMHPESGHFTMTASVVQVGTHDVSHIEQITRILAQKS